MNTNFSNVTSSSSTSNSSGSESSHINTNFAYNTEKIFQNNPDTIDDVIIDCVSRIFDDYRTEKYSLEILTNVLNNTFSILTSQEFAQISINPESIKRIANALLSINKPFILEDASSDELLRIANEYHKYANISIRQAETKRSLQTLLPFKRSSLRDESITNEFKKNDYFRCRNSSVELLSQIIYFFLEQERDKDFLEPIIETLRAEKFQKINTSFLIICINACTQNYSPLLSKLLNTFIDTVIIDRIDIFKNIYNSNTNKDVFSTLQKEIQKNNYLKCKNSSTTTLSGIIELFLEKSKDLPLLEVIVETLLNNGHVKLQSIPLSSLLICIDTCIRCYGNQKNSLLMKLVTAFADDLIANKNNILKNIPVDALADIIHMYAKKIGHYNNKLITVIKNELLSNNNEKLQVLSTKSLVTFINACARFNYCTDDLLKAVTTLLFETNNQLLENIDTIGLSDIALWLIIALRKDHKFLSDQLFVSIISELHNRMPSQCTKPNERDTFNNNISHMIWMLQMIIQQSDTTLQLDTSLKDKITQLKIAVPDYLPSHIDFDGYFEDFLKNNSYTFQKLIAVTSYHFLIENQKCIVQFCDSDNYLSADQILTGYSHLAIQLLQKNGYNIIQIPYWEWNKITRSGPNVKQYFEKILQPATAQSSLEEKKK